jgi:multisubunit Na+/H+ antiporter MnhG subunit
MPKPLDNPTATPPHAMSTIWTIGIFSVIYAVVRYVAFTPKYADHIPGFIFNKAVGMAASLFLVCAFWSKCRGWIENADTYFRATFVAVVIHIPLSIVLLNPGYFPEFFVHDGSKLKFWGEMVILFGALGLALLWQNNRARLSLPSPKKLESALFAVLFCHVGSMGICRGVNINAKHAYLPPMWLLSLVGISVGLWVVRTRNIGNSLQRADVLGGNVTDETKTAICQFGREQSFRDKGTLCAVRDQPQDDHSGFETVEKS